MEGYVANVDRRERCRHGGCYRLAVGVQRSAWPDLTKSERQHMLPFAALAGQWAAMVGAGLTVDGAVTQAKPSAWKQSLPEWLSDLFLTRLGCKATTFSDGCTRRWPTRPARGSGR